MLPKIFPFTLMIPICDTSKQTITDIEGAWCVFGLNDFTIHMDFISEVKYEDELMPAKSRECRYNFRGKRNYIISTECVDTEGETFSVNMRMNSGQEVYVIFETYELAMAFFRIVQAYIFGDDLITEDYYKINAAAHACKARFFDPKDLFKENLQ